MSQEVTGLIVRKSITVEAPQDRAFAVFCHQMGSWWPLDGKSIGASKAVDAVLEPRAGGRWYERGEDGSECEWGRVLAYEPHDRVVLDWQISAAWSYDPSISSELEVRFVPDGDARTRVELEHRGLEAAFGPAAAQMYAIFDSADGWGDILTRYAAATA